jgi:myosin heavy subunit
MVKGVFRFLSMMILFPINIPHNRYIVFLFLSRSLPVVVTSLISMMAEYSATAIQHPAIVVSGILGMILSPYAKFQQEKLTQVKALEQTNSVLEDELKYLKQQYEQISKRVEEVNARTTKLRSLQSTLTTLQSANIQSIDQLEQQVQQSKEIVAQFQQNTKAMILQNLITVMVHCDQNHTMTLEDHEIDTLISSLESIHHVRINATKIRQLIIDQNQRSMTAIMEMARHLIINTPSLTSTTSTTMTNVAAAAATTVVPTSTSPPVTTAENDTIFSYIES